MTQGNHTSIDSIKEIALIKIILGIEQLYLQFSLYRFDNVQMEGIWRKKKNGQSSFLLIRNAFLNDFFPVYKVIIQHHKRFFAYLKEKLFHIFQYKLNVNVAFGSFPPARVLPVYEAKTVDFICFFRKDTDFFIEKLPTVWNVSLAAYMGFIFVIQVYVSFSAYLLKFLEFLYLKNVMFFNRFAFGATLLIRLYRLSQLLTYT